MCLKPQPPQPIPAEIAVWGERHLDADSPYRLVGDTLFAQFHDADFTDLYHPEGKPALSPVLLAFVTIFQQLEKLPDRAAANAFETRLDWKYALHRPFDDEGFDPSVLVDFRQRLLDHEAEARFFTAILSHFQAMGLLKTRGRQRTDSTHVLGAIRALNRLQTAGESMRLALNALAEAAPDWLEGQVQRDWLKRYGSPFKEWHLPQGERERKELVEQIGQDGRLLLLAIYTPTTPEELRALPAVDILRRVWIQQFYTDDEQIRWRTAEELPPATLAINSPHDPQARYSKKRSTIWVGYKVHLTESCDDETPRLITNVEVTPAPIADTDMTGQIHQHLDDAERLPATHLVDAGYVDAGHLVDSQREHQVDLFGPVPINGTWQAKAGKGFDANSFRVDWEAKIGYCPQGKASCSWQERQDGNDNPVVTIAFRSADCCRCEVREDCTTSPRHGRKITIRLQEEHEALQAARQRQQTAEFKQEYALRAGIEGSLSQGVRRCGLRQSRYVGEAKTRLQELFVATALNIARVSTFLAGEAFKERAEQPFVRLMHALA